MKKLFSVCMLAVFISFFPISIGGTYVEAQLQKVGSGTASELGLAAADGDTALIDLIKNIVNWVLGLVSLIAVIFLIYGGFQYITAAGDSSRAENAKRTIMYAIVGLIVIGLSLAIVNFVLTAIMAGGKPK